MSISNREKSISHLNKKKSVEFDDVNNQLGILATDENKAFLSTISHNIKNPFGALLGYSHLITEDFTELSEADKILYLNEIKSTANLTYRYLERFLEWIYYRTGNVSLEIKDNNLLEIITTSLKDVLSSTNYSTDLQLNISKELYAYIDEDTISKMLYYVLENALKYSQPNSVINIGAQVKEGYINLIIEDNGIGIPEEIMNKLFNIAEKLSFQNNFEAGSGLGLILSREIITMNGGSISISNVSKGTKVLIKLPSSEFN